MKLQNILMGENEKMWRWKKNKMKHAVFGWLSLIGFHRSKPTSNQRPACLQIQEPWAKIEWKKNRQQLIKTKKKKSRWKSIVYFEMCTLHFMLICVAQRQLMNQSFCSFSVVFHIFVVTLRAQCERLLKTKSTPTHECGRKFKLKTAYLFHCEHTLHDLSDLMNCYEVHGYDSGIFFEKRERLNHKRFLWHFIGTLISLLSMNVIHCWKLLITLVRLFCLWK